MNEENLGKIMFAVGDKVVVTSVEAGTVAEAMGLEVGMTGTVMERDRVPYITLDKPTSKGYSTIARCQDGLKKVTP